MRGFHFPRAVGAVPTCRAHKGTFARGSFVALEPPVEPRKINLGEIPSAGFEEVTAVAEVLAKPHDWNVELADGVVAFGAAVVSDVVGAAEHEENGRVDQVVK